MSTPVAFGKVEIIGEVPDAAELSASDRPLPSFRITAPVKEVISTDDIEIEHWEIEES